MKYFVWGLLIGTLVTPSPPPVCRDELWLVDEPREAHYACQAGAVLEIEPHVIKCKCEKSHVLLTEQAWR